MASVGLALEYVADEQKFLQKRKDPKSPVIDGIYYRVRHPNYLGEILFHTGISGMALSSTLGNGLSFGTTVACLLSPVMMIGVMFGAAKRLDKSAAEKYGDRPDFKEWMQRSGSILPRFGP